MSALQLLYEWLSSISHTQGYPSNISLSFLLFCFLHHQLFFLLPGHSCQGKKYAIFSNLERKVKAKQNKTLCWFISYHSMSLLPLAENWFSCLYSLFQIPLFSFFATTTLIMLWPFPSSHTRRIVFQGHQMTTALNLMLKSQFFTWFFSSFWLGSSFSSS